MSGDDEARKETETTPAMEVHLGEIVGYWGDVRKRHCIIWLDGKRWEGDLQEVKPRG